MASQIRAVYTASSASISPHQPRPPHWDSRAFPRVRSFTRSSYKPFVIRPLKSADGGKFVEEFDIHGTDKQIDVLFHLEYIHKNTANNKAGYGKHIWKRIVEIFHGQ